MGRKSDPRPERPTVTRYVGPDGRRCRRDAPGARKITKTTESYFVRLVNRETGKREWIALETTELGEAYRKLGAILEDREKEAAGILTPQVRHALRPIADHVGEWIEQLRAGGKTSEKQLAQLRSRVLHLARLAGWERLGQLTRDTAVKALARLQGERTANMPAEHQGRGAQTRNHYTRHIKQLCAWLVEEGRLERSPVAAVDLVNVETDLRHARRSPTDGEVAALLAYCEGRLFVAPPPPTRRGITGPGRALAYRVAMATGLRAGEVRQLTALSFDLERGAVTCRARVGKNRRLARLELPPWLVEEVRAWLAAGHPLWERWPASHPGLWLEADLIAAGVPVATETAEGKRFLDYHSLRHWYVTWAANQPGISPKVLQQIVRHSDPRLTMEVYAKAAQQSEARRVAGDMPRPGTPGAPMPPPPSPQDR